MPYEYHALCERVVDGDTIDCTIDLGFSIKFESRVRLLGINAPETRTRDLEEKEAGLEVAEWLRREIEGKDVILHTQYDKRGKFGRVLAEVWMNDVNLNQHLLDTGMAEPYDK